MKLTFDTSNGVFSASNPKLLGTVLSHWMHTFGLVLNEVSHNGVEILSNDPDWRRVPDTPREFLVALMGDGVYDLNPSWDHFYHIHTGLHLMWACDGDTSIIFRKELKDGFTIINARNGANDRWEIADLDDPRNDPEYHPSQARSE